MADNRLVKLTRGMYEEVFNQGKLEAINRYVAEDMVEHQPLGPGVPPGREGLRQWAIMMRTAFPDSHFEIEDSVAEGDKVWARATFDGTNTGSFMGVPPTGKKVQSEAIDIIRFNGDRMVEHWGVFDQFAMMQQLGLVHS